MNKSNKIIQESFAFNFFREFSNNSSFLFFPLISEIVLYGFKVPSAIHFYLIIGLFLQTYLFVRLVNTKMLYVFIINSFVPFSYLYFEYLLEGNIFSNNIYSLYFYYTIINSLILSFIKTDNYKFNKILVPIDIFIKLLLIPVFYYVLDFTIGNTYNNILGFYFFESNIHTFLLCIFIFLGIIFSIDSYLSVIRENILEKVLSVLHKYSTWIVDEKDLSNSVTKGEMDLSSKKMFKSVVFMDIRGFTSWSEQHEPEYITNMLNGFYLVAENLISNYNGVINKYVADEIVFLFDDLVNAINYSLELKVKEIEYLEKFGLKVGIGINAGEVIYGWIGSEFKKEQTVIGDVVNVAARLEGGVNQIKISKDIVPPEYKINDLGNILLKGKSEEMSIVEILGKKETKK